MQRQLCALFALALAALAMPAAAQRLVVNPILPTYGQPVAIEVKDASSPMYLPATRYTRVGTTITIDYEYTPGGFGPFAPDFGASTVSLGELAAGNYAVRARLFDINQPTAAPKVVQTNVAVVPPAEWGIYTVPREPQAYAPAEVMIRSAAYFDPASMRATIAGNVIRVDFTYKNDAPVMGATPPGMSTFGSVAVPGLAPGNYQVEGWGRPTTGGEYERFFTKAVRVDSAVPVVEFYSATLDHYFISAGSEEIALVDRGAMGDWKRTGQAFSAWARAADAPPGAVPVCRFYARGPNSHFYTGSKQECDYLKALEISQRADANTRGEAFLGWAIEGVAFWALMPQGGACAGGMRPVFRAFNNRVAQMDSNHRFTADSAQRAAMSVGWIDEGTHLCAGP